MNLTGTILMKADQRVSQWGDAVSIPVAG